MLFRFALPLFACLACAGFLARAEEKAGEVEWMTNFAQAKEKATKEGKHLILDFTGSDWCGWCIKLKKEVFETKEFKEWAAKKAILVEVDFPRKKKLEADLAKQNAELQKKYEIQGYPTIIVLDSKGEKTGQTGYVEGGPAAWIKECEAQMGKK